jgi:hypothetical protein
MNDLVINCTNCGKQLRVTNVTGGAGTQGYTVGCVPCGAAHGIWDSGGTIQSSTVPIAANHDTTVYRA